MSDPVLTLRGIDKTFGSVTALAGVDLDAVAGEVHAVLGENGAGKSTLMKVIYGLLRPDAGVLRLDGLPVRFASPLAARHAGIGMVHQEFALIDALTVSENLAPTLTPPGALRWRRARVVEAARRLASEMGLELGDPEVRVRDLPVGARQRLELLRALANRARVLILDEPTAVLTPAEVRQLFLVLDRLRRGGTAILFITHKLAEVSALADRITVMRRGRVVARARRGELDEAALARAMVGELAAAAAPTRAPLAAPVRLALDAVTVAGASGRAALCGVSLAVHAGELFGVAGVDGNGQTELFELLTGLRRPRAGRLLVGGVPVRRFEPAALLAMGLAAIPPDRQRLGAVAAMSVADNAVLSAELLRRVSRGGFIRPAAQQAVAGAMVSRYAIGAGGLAAPAGSLSGGNLQKLIVARALALEPQVLIAANPTRGLDVGAAQAVYAALDAALQRGAAVLLISADLDELVARCHRLVVLSRGRVSATRERPFRAEELGALLGGADEAA